MMKSNALSFLLLLLLLAYSSISIHVHVNVALLERRLFALGFAAA